MKLIMIGTTDTLKPAKDNAMPCETPNCSDNCTYAYNCHEKRMGRAKTILLSGVGLAIAG